MTTLSEAIAEEAALDWPTGRTSPRMSRARSEMTTGEWHRNAGCDGNDGAAGFPVGREFRVFRL